MADVNDRGLAQPVVGHNDSRLPRRSRDKPVPCDANPFQ